MGVADRVRQFRKGKAGQIKPIIDYIESSWGLGWQLFPVQKFILKCFYGLPLDAVNRTIKVYDDKFNLIDTLTEMEYLHHLSKENRTNLRSHDDVLKHKNKLILICGRRSGKSLITSSIASYETYRLLNLENPHDFYGVKKNTKISITCVATGKEQAKEVFDEMRSHYNDCPFFGKYVSNNASLFQTFKTEYDKKFDTVPSIHVRVKSCQGKGLRGASNIVAIIDEIAHFIAEAKSDASDRNVFEAIEPSTKTFINPEGKIDGKVILISSPLGKSGVFWEQYIHALENTVDETAALVIQAPTWEVNSIFQSDAGIEEMKKLQKSKDPAVFACEYGAKFTDEITSWIGDSQFLMQCIDPDQGQKQMGRPGVPHYMGVDLAFTEDGTAIAIGHVNEENQIELDFHRVISPKNKDDIDFVNTDFEGGTKVLDTEKLLDYIQNLNNRFYIKAGIFDQEEGFSFEQGLARRGLKTIRRFAVSERKKSDQYKMFRKLLMDKKIKLYYDEEMIQELRHLQRKVVSDYVERVNKPNSGGWKDDLSDALARMVALAYEDLEKGNSNVRMSGSSSMSRGTIAGAGKRPKRGLPRRNLGPLRRGH